MKNIDKERRAALLYLANMQMQLKAGLYFESLGWQQRADGRLYPPKGNYSMSLGDAVCQLEMVATSAVLGERMTLNERLPSVDAIDAMIEANRRLVVALFWQPRGWSYRLTVDPPGLYRDQGNGYMNDQTAYAEMQRVKSGEEVPF